MSLVDCFRAIINNSFHLAPADQNGGVVVKDIDLSAVSYSLTFIGGKDISSFGFFAESPSKAQSPEPLALLASTSIPGVGLSGVSKMCDGIVIFSIGNREYILGVELKSGGIQGANQQIKNSEILCEWLTKLLKECRHWNGVYKFSGVLVRVSRKTKNKGMTKHSRNNRLRKEGNILKICNSNQVRLVQIAACIDQP